MIMRRYSRIISFVASIVVMGIIAFVYFYPDASQGNVLRQYDTQQGIAIGREAKAYAEQTGETVRWTNSLFSGMPNFQISPSYPSDGMFRWINTVMGLGLPSPANLVFMMMAGFFILLMAMKMRWYVALAGAVAYGFSSYFIIIIGAGHIWKFVTLAYIPPTIAGMVLCYQGRYLVGSALAALFAMMQIAGNHVQMSYYFLFVVAGFVVVYLLMALKDRAAMKRWGIATASLVVAGILAVMANSPSLYNTYEYSKETMRGRHSELTQPKSDDSRATEGLDRDYITQYSYGRAETFSLLIPDIKGGASVKPEKGSNTMLTLGSMPEAKKMAESGDLHPIEAQYLEYLTQYFGEPEGTNGPVYVGAIICALFILGLFVIKGPWKWMLLVLTLFSIFLAWGRNFMWFTDLMIDYMPMYSKFRTVESILVIAEFTMPLLGAMALQKVLTDPDGAAKYMRPLLWSVGIPAFFCIVALAMPGVYGDAITSSDLQNDQYISQSLAAQGYDKEQITAFSLQNPHIYDAVESLRYGMVRADALRSLVFLLLAGVIIYVYMRKRLSATVAGVAVAALVLVDLYGVNKRYLNHDSFVPKALTMGLPIEKTPADEAILADTAMNYRVMDIPRFWSPAPSYYHKMVGGYHAAKLTRYQDLIDRHLNGFLTGEPAASDWQVLDMLNAKYVVGPDGTPLLNDRAMGNAWFVDTLRWAANADEEMAALDRIDLHTSAVADRKFENVIGPARHKAPGDTIYETTYAPGRLTYKARSAKGGVAVFSEVYFPWGWHATVDGKPAELGRVNYVLRALNIPAGEHEVTMVFDPQSLHTTDTLARIAIVLIYLALAAGVALTAVMWVRKNKTNDGLTA